MSIKGIWYGPSWLPVRIVLTANYNAAHYSHLHVEGIPKKYGTPPLTNPGMPDSTQEIYDAILDYFPGTRIGIYKRRYISGTTRWSQHSWSNGLDVYAYGAAAQKPIYDMLTSPTKPEGGDIDMEEIYARLQASLIRAGHDLGDWSPYLPEDDPDCLPGADGSWGDQSRIAQDAANVVGGTKDAIARKKANKAQAELDQLRDNLHQA